MPALLAIWQVFWGFASSRVGNIVLAALIAFTYGYHKATVKAQREAELVQAELQKAYWTELERQRKVAKDIETRARDREGEDAVISRAMQKKIADFEAAEKERANVSSQPQIPHAKAAAPRSPVFCVVDDDFLNGLRGVDSANKASRPARRASHVRKAR
jgi:hypothetical protein